MKSAFEEPLARGIALFNAGRYPEAAVLLRRCVKLGAGDAVALYLDHIRHALCSRAAGSPEYAALIGRRRYREAWSALEKAFREDPRAAFRGVRDLWLKSAFEGLEKAPKGSPWTSFFRSSQAWTAIDDLKSLSQLHKASAGSKERAWMRYFIAEILLRRKQLVHLADAEIRAVVSACPWLWEARCLQAEIGFALGKPGRIASLDAMPTLGGDQGSFLAWRGALKLWSGAYREAALDLARAEALGSHDALCWGGGALTLQGRLEEGFEKLSALLERDPFDPEALIFRAEALRRLGRPAECLELLDAMLERAPEHPWALANRALCALALDDEASARRCFLRLVYGPLAPDLVVTRAVIESLLGKLLTQAGGCRLVGSHVNLGWMRAAGVRLPRLPNQGDFRPWFKAQGLALPGPRWRPDGSFEARARKAIGRL